MLLKKRIVSLALLFVFVLVGVFTFHVPSKAYPYRECCTLYDEEGHLLGKGDWHPWPPAPYPGFCDCIKLDDPGPCNPYCVYYCIN